MKTDWHRVFGVSLADCLTGLPLEVIQEMELAQHKQRLDAAVVRRSDATVEWPQHWPDQPDGLTDLAEHNLFTYKSPRESLTEACGWELIQYLVSYAKERWNDTWKSRVARDQPLVRLLAVTTRRPQWLQPDDNPFHTQLLPGVYRVRYDTRLAMRVIVPREVALTPKNSLWHLLSGDKQRVQYGSQFYDKKNAELFDFFGMLKKHYQMEGWEVPYTLEDAKRDSKERVLADMTPEERMAGLSVEERMAGLSPEERQLLLRRLVEERKQENKPN